MHKPKDSSCWVCVKQISLLAVLEEGSVQPRKSSLPGVKNDQTGGFQLTREELKARACAVIEAHKDELLSIGKDIFSHPELGYKEFRTAAIVQKTLDKMA